MGNCRHLLNNLPRIAAFGCMLLYGGNLYAQQAAQPDPLRWGYYEFPPRLFTNQLGQPEGELAQVIATIMADSAMTYLPYPYPNRRFVRLLEEQQIDLAFLAKGAVSQQDKFIFSHTVMGYIELRLYWLANAGTELENFTELAGKSVIVVAGFNFGGRLARPPFNRATIHVVEKHERALDALLLGRGEYVLGYRKPFEAVMGEEDIHQLTSAAIQTLPIYMALRADLPDAAVLLDKLESSYRRFFPALYSKYNP